jgi:hypothetical protein
MIGQDPSRCHHKASSGRNGAARDTFTRGKRRGFVAREFRPGALAGQGRGLFGWQRHARRLRQGRRREAKPNQSHQTCALSHDCIVTRRSTAGQCRSKPVSI